MKKVVLYSGGLDSFCLAHAVAPDLLLYFDIGLPEQGYEMERIKLMERAGKLPCPVIYDTRFSLADTKLPNEVLPFRNLYFITAAFCFGSKVYLGKTASSRNLDKDPIFACKLLDTLRYVSADVTKNPNGLRSEDMEILLPFDNKTKSTFVNEFLLNGGTVDDLLETRSCYLPVGAECGVCQSCIRKAMAFVNNDIPIESFDADPTVYFRTQYDYALSVGNTLVLQESLDAMRKLRYC